MNRIFILLLSAVLFVGCASSGTGPQLTRYDLAEHEKRLLRVMPVENKTGDAEYDNRLAGLTVKLANAIENSGKFKVVHSRREGQDVGQSAPDSEAVASVTKVSFNEKLLFGLMAWINTPTVEVQMDMRVIDIGTGEVISTATVSEKAWSREWVAFYIFRLGEAKSQKELEAEALGYALEALANRLFEN